MEDKQKKLEFCRYVFSDKEKKEIAAAMAQAISELKRKEDDLRSVKSEFKSEMDALNAAINKAAEELNSGYAMRNVECTVRADFEGKVWRVYRDDTHEQVREVKMSVDDLQKNLGEDF